MWNGFKGAKGAALGAVMAASFPVAGTAQTALQDFGFETGVSTLGAYVAPKYEISDKFTGRVPLFFGAMSATRTLDGNPATGNFNTASGAVMADYHPFAGAFRVSGGVSVGGYNFTGTITNPKFNNNTYAGVANVTVKQSNDVVPVVSFGYAKTFKNGFGIVAEFGAKIGTYTLTAPDDFVPAGQKAQFATDLAQVNSDLKQVPAIPFVTLGLSYRF